jgi:hypothetical protein
MKSNLTRRSMLRGMFGGMSVALGLPWLEAMSHTARAGEDTGPGKLASPPLRSIFIFMPNGVNPAHWTPKNIGPGQSDFELNVMMKALEKVKGDFNILENLFHAKTAGRNGHWPKVPAFLHGGFVVRTSGRDLDVGGTSLDQLMSQHIGDRTPLPSFELGVDPTRSGVDNAGGGFARIYGSHIAWRDRHTPVPKEIIPQLAFDRLFRTASAAPVTSGFNPNQPAVVKSLQRDDTSVLDIVMDDAKSLRGKVSANDAVKLDEYLESVRAVEKRIENTLKPQKRWINAGKFDLPRPGPGIPETHEEHLGLMLDILTLALWTDSTRIATMMIGEAQSGRAFNFLDGVNGSWHQLSHHRSEAKTLEQYEKIATWHIGQFAKFLEKLKSLDEGGTSLLHNSQILYGCTIRDGNAHDHRNLPILLAGQAQGKIKTGRRIPFAKDTPLNNLYLNMLDHVGVKAQSFGDSTGMLSGLS